MKDPISHVCKDTKSLGLLLMRIVIGGIFLYYGLPKALNWGRAMENFSNMGFPGFFGPIVGVAEVVFAVLLLIGLWTWVSGWGLAIIILVAIISVQISGVVAAGQLTPGLERNLLLIAGSLTLAWHGPGKFSLRR